MRLEPRGSGRVILGLGVHFLCRRKRLAPRFLPFRKRSPPWFATPRATGRGQVPIPHSPDCFASPASTKCQRIQTPRICFVRDANDGAPTETTHDESFSNSGSEHLLPFL